jgi:phage gp46-like protein
MSLDLKLTADANDVYDIGFTSSGDLEMTDGLETAILMSILCEKRTDASEIINPKYRRGDWSNELNDVEGYEVGSKLWLLDQARVNQESFNVGLDALQEGFEWMLEDDLVKSVEIDGEFDSNISYDIDITKQDDKINRYRYENFKLTAVG